MPPFSGLLQVAESGNARALSIDGQHWEIQFRFNARAEENIPGQPDAEKRYTLVASVNPTGLDRQPLHAFLDTEAVALAIDRLYTLISKSSLPFPSIDRFEYWLLDQTEQKPLALLHSCIGADEMGSPSLRPMWMAMPAAQLPIEEIATDQVDYVPPVNCRVERLITERAGQNPRAAWYDRAETTTTEFPPCLIREDWEQEEHYQLCQQYIRRLAPRLLMLHGLTREDRQRLEQACRENAADVERFHSLYPEIIDQKLLMALRVEARIRHDAGPAAC